MKIAALILGIIGGLFGIIAAILVLMAGGIGSAVGAEESSYMIGAALIALFSSIMAVIAGAIALAAPRVAGILLIIFGFIGLVSIGGFYFISGPLIIIAGILAIAGRRKEVKLGIMEIADKPEVPGSRPNEEIKYCSKCGEPMQLEASFCRKCGTSDGNLEIKNTEKEKV